MVKLIPLANTRRDPRRRSSAGISVEARRGKVMLEGKELKRPVVLQDAAFQRTMSRIREYVAAGLLTVEKLPGTADSVWALWATPETVEVLTVNTPVEIEKTPEEPVKAADTEEKEPEAAVVVETALAAVAETSSEEEPAAEAQAGAAIEEVVDAATESAPPADTSVEAATPATASDVNSKQVARPVRKAIMPRARPVSPPEG